MPVNRRRITLRIPRFIPTLNLYYLDLKVEIMKPICTTLVSGTMLCLSFVPLAIGGPGGTYGPSNGSSGYGPTSRTTPRYYGPSNNNYGPRGGYRPGRDDDDDDDYRPYNGSGFNGGFAPPETVIYKPNIIVKQGTPSPTGNRPYYDRTPDGNFNTRPSKPFANSNSRSRYAAAHRPRYYEGSWYHGDWNTRNRTSNYRPYAWGGWNWGDNKPSAAVVTSPWQYGYWSYSNPYYTKSRGPSYFNYSQPIIATNISADANGQFLPIAVGQMSREQALQIFATARAAFFAGDLDAAQQQIEQAIATLPSDTVLHEFRALVLFARRDYSSAAGTLYAVLSSGPGWDWTTMIGLYPNSNIYTGQLRTLENYCNGNPGAANARFVLAYHYMTAGYSDAAIEMYRQVLTTNPNDTLSAQLLSSLTGQPASQVAQLQPMASQQIDLRYLMGNWSASRPDGSNFQLSLRRDGTYNWSFSQGGRVQQFNGSYTVADSVLVLQQNGQPAMVGQVIPLAGNRFVFKLTGGDPADPGLNFVR